MCFQLDGLVSLLYSYYGRFHGVVGHVGSAVTPGRLNCFSCCPMIDSFKNTFACATTNNNKDLTHSLTLPAPYDGDVTIVCWCRNPPFPFPHNQHSTNPTAHLLVRQLLILSKEAMTWNYSISVCFVCLFVYVSHYMLLLLYFGITYVHNSCCIIIL